MGTHERVKHKNRQRDSKVTAAGAVAHEEDHLRGITGLKAKERAKDRSSQEVRQYDCRDDMMREQRMLWQRRQDALW